MTYTSHCRPRWPNSGRLPVAPQTLVPHEEHSVLPQRWEPDQWAHSLQRETAREGPEPMQRSLATSNPGLLSNPPPWSDEPGSEASLGMSTLSVAPDSVLLWLVHAPGGNSPPDVY